nr:hypothetical protein Iba_chr02dCG8490 [Ipomoea batatas]
MEGRGGGAKIARPFVGEVKEVKSHSSAHDCGQQFRSISCAASPMLMLGHLGELPSLQCLRPLPLLFATSPATVFFTTLSFMFAGCSFGMVGHLKADLDQVADVPPRVLHTPVRHRRRPSQSRVQTTAVVASPHMPVRHRRSPCCKSRVQTTAVVAKSHAAGRTAPPPAPACWRTGLHRRKRCRPRAADFNDSDFRHSPADFK